MGALTPDRGSPAAQDGYATQSGAPLGGWKFSNSKDGVFADYFHVNEADANMTKILDGVSDDAAFYCADMLSTGFMGAEKGNIPIGGTVAVLAQGPVGLMATAGAKLRGADLIIGAESVPSRQKLARTYVADEILAFTSEDAVGRPHAHDHPQVPVRRHGAGLRRLGHETRRCHEGADRFLGRRPAMSRRCRRSRTGERHARS